MKEQGKCFPKACTAPLLPSHIPGQEGKRVGGSHTTFLLYVFFVYIYRYISTYTCTFICVLEVSLSVCLPQKKVLSFTSKSQVLWAKTREYPVTGVSFQNDAAGRVKTPQVRRQRKAGNFALRFKRILTYLLVNQLGYMRMAFFPSKSNTITTISKVRADNGHAPRYLREAALICQIFVNLPLPEGGGHAPRHSSLSQG